MRLKASVGIAVTTLVLCSPWAVQSLRAQSSTSLAERAAPIVRVRGDDVTFVVRDVATGRRNYFLIVENSDTSERLLRKRMRMRGRRFATARLRNLEVGNYECVTSITRPNAPRFLSEVVFFAIEAGETPTATPTVAPTQTPPNTPTATPVPPTVTPAPTATNTIIPTITASPTNTATPTNTAAPTETSSPTPTPTFTASPSPTFEV